MMRLAACLAAHLILASTAEGQSKTAPVFSVDVDNILIDAFVSLRGVPVPGLTAADFELRDNGVPQRLELVASDSQPLQTVLAFDTSGSLSTPEFAALRSASEMLLGALRPEDEATLFTFSDTVRWVSPPTRNKDAIRNALASMQADGGTAITDALYSALLLPKFSGRSLVVLFTDGDDNQSWLDSRQIKVVAQRSNAVIHIVSLRRNAAGGGKTQPRESRNGRALRDIAESTGGRYWETDSSDRLNNVFGAIAEGMGKRYVLRYAPENVTRTGWHKIELKVRGKRGDLRTRRGYWVAARN